MNAPVMEAPKVKVTPKVEPQKERIQRTSASAETEKIVKSISSLLKLERNVEEKLSSLPQESLKELNDTVNKFATTLEDKNTLNAFQEIVKNIAKGVQEFKEAIQKIEELAKDVLTKNKKTQETENPEVKQEKTVEKKDIKELLKETEKLLDKRGFSPERKEEILKDIKETLENPDKINQGIFSTCVASAAINSAIKEGKGSVLVEIFNEQIEKSESLVSSLKTTFGDKAFKEKEPKMLGGSLQAALMSYASSGYVFNADGSTQAVTGSGTIEVIQGLTDTQIVKLHERLNAGKETKVFEQINSIEDLKTILKSNEGGVNVKLRWGEGNHTFHMVNVVGVDNDGNVIIKNSQDEKVANRNYNKDGYEKISMSEFQSRLCFGIIENAPEGLKNTTLINGSDIKETFSPENGDHYVYGINQAVNKKNVTLESEEDKKNYLDSKKPEDEEIKPSEEQVNSDDSEFFIKEDEDNKKKDSES